MKKTLTLIALALTTLSASAQVINVYKSDGTFVTSYDGTTHSVEMAKEAPATGPEYVEMKMGSDQSSTMKWATMNLGATSIAADAATSYGYYYAWGATAKQTDYSQANAPYYNGSAYTKYIESDNKTTLESADDVVTHTYSGWRMPTSADFENLYEACGGTSGQTAWTGTSITADQSSVAKGVYWVAPSSTPISVTCGTGDAAQTISISVNGALFCDGSSMVFFPAAGYMDGASLSNAGTIGYYWSSSLRTSTTNYAYYLSFGSGGVYPQSGGGNRYVGFTVRPVSD